MRQFDVAQLSSPCTDFSVSGKRIEGTKAWVTIAGVAISIALRIPVLVIENVVGILKSAAWDEASGILKAAGYVWDHTILNAADYGVPQRRKRAFIVATNAGPDRGCKMLDSWKAEVHRQSAVYTPCTLRQKMPELGDAMFFNARGAHEPCIISTDGLMPTARTNCGWAPSHTGTGAHRRFAYTPRLGTDGAVVDVAPIEAASFPTISQLGVAGGFNPCFRVREQFDF